MPEISQQKESAVETGKGTRPMENETGMNDANESQMAIDSTNSGHASPREESITLDPNKKLGRGVILGVVAAALVLGIFIVVGIHARASAESTLTSNTQRDAVLSVALTTPTHGADALEVVLPANTQAFIDTPIYARTSGYLKRWYADIGAHVKRGQVLAEIETPRARPAATAG